MDRLDGLLLGSVAAISGCHNLDDGSQYAVAPCHTATAGIAEIACMIIAEMMRYGIASHHHRAFLSIAGFMSQNPRHRLRLPSSKGSRHLRGF